MKFNPVLVALVALVTSVSADCHSDCKSRCGPVVVVCNAECVSRCMLSVCPGYVIFCGSGL